MEAQLYKPFLGQTLENQPEGCVLSTLGNQAICLSACIQIYEPKFQLFINP